MFPTVG